MSRSPLTRLTKYWRGVKGGPLKVSIPVQFMQKAGIRPQPIPLPEKSMLTVLDSHLEDIQPTWSRRHTPVLLGPPLLIAQKLQGNPVKSLINADTLLSLMGSISHGLQLPKDNERTSLAQLWDVDAFIEQTFVTKLPHQPLQALSLEQHEPSSVHDSIVAQPAHQGQYQLPQIVMSPRPGGREVMKSLLCSSMAALSLPEAAEKDIAHELTFYDMVAPGQVLCDQYPTLPLVQIEDRPNVSLAPCAPSRLAQSLQAKPLGLAATELPLDWSMKDPAAPDPSKRLHQVRCAYMFMPKRPICIPLPAARPCHMIRSNMHCSCDQQYV